MRRLAAILTCLAIAGCVPAASQRSQAVEPGTTITLSPGQSATAKGSPLSVRFVAVTEDSRCPRATTCIWAGEVRASIEIREGKQQPLQVELKPGGSADAGDFRVSLIGVEPYPAADRKIVAQDYRATLKIDATR